MFGGGAFDSLLWRWGCLAYQRPHDRAAGSESGVRTMLTAFCEGWPGGRWDLLLERCLSCQRENTA